MTATLITRPDYATAADLATLLGVPDDDLDWQERGLCAQADPEAFFPDRGGSPREAKQICSRCEVRAECLAYALENDEAFGVWGGLSKPERDRLTRGPAHTRLVEFIDQLPAGAVAA